MAEYLCQRHLSPSAENLTQFSPIDGRLQALGLKRTIVATVPEYAIVPHVLAHSDLVFTTGAPFAERMAADMPFQIVDAPAEFGSMDFYLLWHDCKHHSPAHAWLRQQLKAIAGELKADNIVPSDALTFIRTHICRYAFECYVYVTLRRIRSVEAEDCCGFWMKNVVVAALVAAALPFAGANAADLGSHPVVVASAPVWQTGLYAGVTLGAAFGTSRQELPDGYWEGDSAYDPISGRSTSLIGGVEVGMNYVTGNLLLGVEADLSGLN
eukprot:gene32485-37451_t